MILVYKLYQNTWGHHEQELRMICTLKGLSNLLKHLLEFNLGDISRNKNANFLECNLRRFWWFIQLALRRLRRKMRVLNPLIFEHLKHQKAYGRLEQSDKVHGNCKKQVTRQKILPSAEKHFSKNNSFHISILSVLLLTHRSRKSK